MKIGFVNYQVTFKPKNINFDKICIFLYKDYVKLKKDTTSNPLVDFGFYNYLISNDSETKLPVYIRKLFDVFPDILIGYVKSSGDLDFDSVIKWMKNGFNYDGVVNLGTMIDIRNASDKSIGFEFSHSEMCEENIVSNKPLEDENLYLPAISSLVYKKVKHSNDKSTEENKITLGLDRIEIQKGNVTICLPKFNDDYCIDDMSFLKNKKYTEIWVPNINISKKIKTYIGVENVAIMPYPITTPTYEVEEVNLPKDKLIVLMSHDFSKDFESQNPMASINAFKQAFIDNDNALLVCYLSNSDYSECYERLVSAISFEPKAKLIVEESTDVTYYSYLHYSHCLISLHRNSFSGHRFAEALSLGKNLIISSNNDNYEYINSDNSFLIKNLSDELVIRDAAETLKYIYFDENVLSSKNTNAVRFIQKHFSPSTIGFMMNLRINELSNSGINIFSRLGSAPHNQISISVRVNSPLRSFIKKIPYAISIFRKIKGLDKKSTTDVTKKIKSIDKSEVIMNILLKNVHRPEYLE
ncbi:TPA: glycosyltransferase [Yersinia enterocolitica]|nr:glycosyltransferase [Yersinia enterocolitica]